jgi:hypothetical protein
MHRRRAGGQGRRRRRKQGESNCSHGVVQQQTPRKQRTSRPRALTAAGQCAPPPPPAGLRGRRTDAQTPTPAAMHGAPRARVRAARAPQHAAAVSRVQAGSAGSLCVATRGGLPRERDLPERVCGASCFEWLWPSPTHQPATMCVGVQARSAPKMGTSAGKCATRAGPVQAGSRARPSPAAPLQPPRPNRWLSGTCKGRGVGVRATQSCVINHMPISGRLTARTWA